MLRLAVIIMLLLAAAGCSPSREIADRSNRIAERAQDDLAAWDRVERTHKDMATEASRGRDRARADIVDAHRINKALTGVEDQTPWWVGTLGWLAVAVIAVCVVVVIWQLGLGQIVRVAIGWLPRKDVQDADLAASMLNPDKPESAREYIAMRRGADPLFDAAMRKAQGEK
jgi:hypothetical protein